MADRLAQQPSSYLTRAIGCNHEGPIRLELTTAAVLLHLKFIKVITSHFVLLSLRTDNYSFGLTNLVTYEETRTGQESLLEVITSHFVLSGPKTD